jgi:predicted N-acetyltransferase YhbS
MPDRIAIRPIGIDDLSAVRYVHTAAFKATALSNFEEPDIDAFVAYVRGPEYSDRILAARTFGAWVGHELVGTAAWDLGDQGTAARMFSIFVHPLFMGSGIGRRLVEAVEEDARKAGLAICIVRAPLNTIGFFEQQGYVQTARGACAFVPGRTTPFALMAKPIEIQPDEDCDKPGADCESSTPRGP